MSRTVEGTNVSLMILVSLNVFQSIYEFAIAKSSNDHHIIISGFFLNLEM